MSTVARESVGHRTSARSTTATDWGLFVVRLVLGIIFFAHGAQKVLGWWAPEGHGGLAALAVGAEKMGIPVFLMYVDAFTEFLGGIMLIVGLFSRLAAAGLVISMLVAIAKVHGGNGFFAGGGGYEFNLALIAMSLAVLIAGPGRIGLGDWEGRLLAKK